MGCCMLLELNLGLVDLQGIGDPLMSSSRSCWLFRSLNLTKLRRSPTRPEHHLRASGYVQYVMTLLWITTRATKLRLYSGHSLSICARNVKKSDAASFPLRRGVCHASRSCSRLSLQVVQGQLKAVSIAHQHLCCVLCCARLDVSGDPT
jgi:hypothetical protein